MHLKILVAKLWNVPSRWGDKLGWNWLTYNPGVFFEFAMVARRNAPLFAKAIEKVFPSARRICDVGAGTGQFVQELQKLGKEVDGFEYSPWGRCFARLIGVRLGRFELNAHPPLSEMKSYDLVFSLEVGEHIPPSLSSQFVKTLVNAGPIVVVTCAPPGQTGHGHINCREKSFWTELFAREGFLPSEADHQALLEEFARYPRLSSFIPVNLMVFRKGSA